VYHVLVFTNIGYHDSHMMACIKQKAPLVYDIDTKNLILIQGCRYDII